MQRFWAWYERHIALHTFVVTIAFVWQLSHLYWLTTHVAAQRLLGSSLFSPSPFFQFVLIVADYIEIPALVSASLLYSNVLRKDWRWKPIGYLLLINTQWIHILWITDQYIVNVFTDTNMLFPIWIAWLAISIDYLELPVMYDTLRQSLRYAAEYLKATSKA